MICNNCGTENRADRKFCSKCGSKLAMLCPLCGSPNQPDDAFCGECGAGLSGATTAAPHSPSAASPSPSVAVPTTERRLVSVLFADLVGFTALSESRDAEEVRELLTRYFDTCRSLAERYGGVVEKFIGDAVMAVWGTPVSNEDDAERAVRAGLDLVEAVAALGRETGAPGLQARAGVLTGEAAVTLGAQGQGMVAGDLVNSASRLQTSAEPGTVVTGEATVHAAGEAIAFQELGELTLKGKAGPVRAWRALRVVAKRAGVGRAEGLEPPFVGREEELRLIKDLLHGAARERRARLISVTGIPGIGKSRLAWEFLKYLDGLAENVYWHQGRSPAYGESVTFWALSEMVRMRAGISEGEDAASSREKLAATVAEFAGDAGERRWIEPRVAHLLGLGEAPVGDREELFSAWRTFFERIAAHGPVVMVFEDLQWADAGLVDFIESILEWSRSHPILVLTLARPEISERRPNWGAGQRSFTSLHLEALSEAAMRDLLQGFVREVPEAVVTRVLARAEGVPLYAVETVRMLADRGVLTQQGPSYAVTGELGDLEVPDTLHALIASRLDTLKPEQRSLLQDASVLGKTFTARALSAVSGTEQAVVEEELRGLTRKELLSLDVDPRSPERGQYGFVQALIRGVAYSTLSRRDRRAKHLSAAHYFESLGDDELAGLVAAHYLEAHRESREGPEAEALAGKAREWLTQAGERALSLGSPEQALTYFEQALQVSPAGTERKRLLQQASEAAKRSSKYEQSRAHLEEAIALHEKAGDVIGVAGAAAKLCETLGFLGQYAQGIEQAERAMKLLGDAKADGVRVELATALSFAYSFSGSPQRSLELAEEALVVAERLDDPERLVWALASKAGALFDLGRHREAAMLSRGCLTLAEGAGLLRAQATALTSESLYEQDENPREAMSAAIKGVEVARRAGDRGRETTNLLNVAELGILVGDWSGARVAVGEAAQVTLADHAQRWLDLLEAMLIGLVGEHARALRSIEDQAR
ncbi:MAG: AAA family ATPase, partial [Chloroflexota bacterium]